MFNLREYRPRPTRLADHLPWAALVRPGTILNKDGSLQRIYKFRGPDLASSTDAQILSSRSRLNNGLRRLGSRWCLHIEAHRRPAYDYPHSIFPDPVSQMIDDERRGRADAGRGQFETDHHLTLTYLPPPGAGKRLRSVLLENLSAFANQDGGYSADLQEFETQSQQFCSLLADVMIDFEALDDAGTLSYLHSCISTRAHRVAVPDVPVFLDSLLTDDDLVGGLQLKLGRSYLQTVSIRAYPATSTPELLESLNLLGLPYRWMSRFLPLDKDEANQALARIRKRWFAKRKGAAALLREAITREVSALEDGDAISKGQDADAALVILGSNAVSMGYFTPTVTLMDEDVQVLADKVRHVLAAVNRAGFVAKVEDLNGLEAWLGSLPGHAYADCRRPMISTLNLCDMLPIHASWGGPKSSSHLTALQRSRGVPGEAPPLLQARTDGATPFRLDLHQGDVGHALVVGPTGSGKSVLLSLLAAQWLRYPEAQIFFFDKGGSARACTLLMQGSYFPLGAERSPLSLQPLKDIDTASGVAWAREWLHDVVAQEGCPLTGEIKQEIWRALVSLSLAPGSHRTVTMFHDLVQSLEVKAALQPFTSSGPYGSMVDGSETPSSQARWQTFEMAELLEKPPAVAPVLTYLFHHLEQRFDGRPTLLILDEAWLFLDHTLFSRKIRDWLKTLRKKNVAVIFATQSLADIAGSSLKPILVESCPTKIFLPNPESESASQSEIYRHFGLNDRQITILSRASPKKHYYFHCPSGSRLFDLSLGPVQRSVLTCSSPDDHRFLDQIESNFPKDQFADEFIKAKGLRGGGCQSPVTNLQTFSR